MGVLRILLAACVYFYHMGLSNAFALNILDGGAAVFCFFVVSGFYMEMVLTQKYTAKRLGDRYVLAFYASRFWRLYPIYLVVLLSTLILSTSSLHTRFPKILDISSCVDLFSCSRSVFTWFINLTMMGLNFPSTSDLLIGPSWSLGIEIGFYAIAPFVLMLNARKLWLLSGIGVFLQIVPYGQHSPVLFGFHFFLLGALARRYSDEINRWVLRIWTPSTLVLYLVVFAFMFCSIPNDLYIGMPNEHTHNSVVRLFYPVLIAVIVPILHERTKNSNLDIWIGQMSYPFYLMHALVIDSFSWVDSEYRTLSLLVVCIVLSGALVFLENRYVDPWRARFSRGYEKASMWPIGNERDKK